MAQHDNFRADSRERFDRLPGQFLQTGWMGNRRDFDLSSDDA